MSGDIKALFAEKKKQKSRGGKTFELPLWEIAENLNVSQKTLESWVYEGRQVPMDKLLDFCHHTKQNLWDVAPEVFQPSPAHPAIKDYIAHCNAA